MRARAEALPFPDRAIDATMAVLTLHRWADGAGGLAEPGLERLRADLATGAWHARHGHLLAADAVDLGYRLVVAHLPNRGA